jgi:hypothetical protein
LEIVVNRIGNLIRSCPTRTHGYNRCVYKRHTTSGFSKIKLAFDQVISSRKYTRLSIRFAFDHIQIHQGKSSSVQGVSSESRSSLILHLCNVDPGSANFYTTILKFWLGFGQRSSILNIEQFWSITTPILQLQINFGIWIGFLHLGVKYIQVYCFYHFIFK